MMKLVTFSCILAVAAGNLITPWSVPIAAPWTLGTPLLTTSNYRGPLSLAPGQPANIIAADGRPLDTLDVNLDRSAHLTAQALTGSGLHLLKKRSIAPLITPLTPVMPLGIPTPLGLNVPLTLSAPVWTPSNYRGPLSLAPGQPANIIAADGRPLDTLDVNLDRSAHLTAKALSGSGEHLLKKRSAPLVAPLAARRVVLRPAPLISTLSHVNPSVLSTGIATDPLTLARTPVVLW